jgi:hypothetical protein
MKQSTLAVNGPLTVIVDDMEGDLQVAGWERAEVSAKTGGDEFDLRGENDQAYVHCKGNLILYLPREANLKAGTVGGDADIRALSGSVQIERVDGDLIMRDVGPVKLNSVGGDLDVHTCSGDLSVERVGSDASLRDLQGTVSLTLVGSDLYLRDLGGNVDAQAEADAILFLQPKPGAKIAVKAGGDILVGLPASIDAELVLQGGSMESIRVDFPGVEPGEEAITRRVKLGSGATDIHLTAKGDLIVTSQADEWQSLVDLEIGGLDGLLPEGFPGIPADFHERISHSVQKATQRAVRASERAQRQGDRSQRRVEAAVHRANEKIRAAERRSHFTGVVIHSGSGKPFFAAPSVPPMPFEPVSNEERLTVLKMLQDKKISLQEAEKLLAALDGK